MPPEADAIEVETPIGLKVKAQGDRVARVLAAAAIAAPLLFLAYKHHENGDQKLDALGEKMSEVVYVLSLTQADRERLNLSMPDSLRRKARRERDRDGQ